MFIFEWIINIDDYPSEYHTQLLRLSAGEAIVNEQYAVLYDGFSQRGEQYWANLLPRVTKKVIKKKVEEFKTVETVYDFIFHYNFL